MRQVHATLDFEKHLMDLHVTFNPVIKEQNLQSDALDIESNIIAVSLMERPPLNASFQNRAILSVRT